MIDGVGDIQNLMVVGGRSDIGIATMRKVANSGRLRRVVLVGRNLRDFATSMSEELDGVQIDLIEIDLREVTSLESRIREHWGDGIDATILTAGFLPPAFESPINPDFLIDAGLVNYLAQAVVGTVVVDLMMKQGFGTLAVVSSVAVERPRKDNFVYGSSKIGLDSWAIGISEYLKGIPIRVFVVRPGMVRTKMTVGLPELPMTVDKEQVADVICRNLVGGPPVVWVPRRFRWIFVVLRHLPRWAFRRLSPSGGIQVTAG